MWKKSGMACCAGTRFPLFALRLFCTLFICILRPTRRIDVCLQKWPWDRLSQCVAFYPPVLSLASLFFFLIFKMRICWPAAGGDRCDLVNFVCANTLAASETFSEYSLESETVFTIGANENTQFIKLSKWIGNSWHNLNERPSNVHSYFGFDIYFIWLCLLLLLLLHPQSHLGYFCTFK